MFVSLLNRNQELNRNDSPNTPIFIASEIRTNSYTTYQLIPPY